MWNVRIHILFNDSGEFAVIDMSFHLFYLNFDTHNQTAIFIPRLDELYAVHKKLITQESDSQ